LDSSPSEDAATSGTAHVPRRTSESATEAIARREKTLADEGTERSASE
jgi:hypothetical protein